MISRRRFVGTAAGAILVLRPGRGRAQEGTFLKAEEAPRQLFADVSEVSERSLPLTTALLRSPSASRSASARMRVADSSAVALAAF